MAAKLDETALGKAIRARRMEAGLTLKELANRVGVHFTTVSAWERGRSMPGFDIMPKLAAALGTRPGDLFGEIWELSLPIEQEPFRLAPIAGRTWEDFRRRVESLRFSLAAERARQSRELSAGEIARRTGMGIDRVRELLDGRSDPGLSEALALSAALGLQVLPEGDGGLRSEGGGAAPRSPEGASTSLEQLRRFLKVLPEGPRHRLLGLWGLVLDLVDPFRKKD